MDSDRSIREWRYGKEAGTYKGIPLYVGREQWEGEKGRMKRGVEV